jgi:hypothetical protein
MLNPIQTQSPLSHTTPKADRGALPPHSPPAQAGPHPSNLAAPPSIPKSSDPPTCASGDSAPCIPNSALSFPRSPGETPRAYSAFLAYFRLGHRRCLPAVAEKLGEGLSTVKNWSSRFDWSERIQAFNSGLLERQAAEEAARHSRDAADWAARLRRFREQEWEAAQKLLAAVQCFLESFGEEHLQTMTLAQVSRALGISSKVGRLALVGADLPKSSAPELAPIQQQILQAMKRVYGQPGKDVAPGGLGPLTPDSQPSHN